MEFVPEIAPGARSILKSVTEAFAHAGFDSVSVIDVAAQVGVGKAKTRCQLV